MPWKTRNHRQYYYVTKRVDGRVFAEYVGAGPAAQIAANLTERRRLIREQCKVELARLREVRSVMLEADRWIELLVAAELLLAGYYRCDRGPWRIRNARAVKRNNADPRAVRPTGQVG